MAGNAEPGKGQLWKVLGASTCVVVSVYVCILSYPRIGTKGLPTDLLKHLTPSCSFYALFPKAFLCLKLPTELSKALSSLDTQIEVTLMGLIRLTLLGSFENSSRSPFAMHPKSLQSIIRVCFLFGWFCAWSCNSQPGKSCPACTEQLQKWQRLKVLTQYDNHWIETGQWQVMQVSSG